MSRGLGRVERVCLSVLAEAEQEEPVVGRTADDIVLVAFGIKDPWAPGEKGDAASWDDKEYRGRYCALSSVGRALRRLVARGLVQENGLTKGYIVNPEAVDIHGQPYKNPTRYCERRKLYRAPGQRPILLPDQSAVPPA